VPQNIKEIDKRIRSVRNTQQITKAMKMVAAAKLRRAQDRLTAARPYGRKLSELLAALSGASIEHPFFESREVAHRLVIVISSDKGLCGSYNANIIREAQLWVDANSEGIENELLVIGRKAGDYFKRRSWPLRRVLGDLGGVVDLARINEVADEAMGLYLAGDVQEIVVFYTRFVSTLSYRPESFVLLPLSGKDQDASGDGRGSSSDRAPARDYIYEPSAAAVLEMLLPKSVRNRLYNAAAEAFTSEHGARMTSMDSATNNAGELIDQLVLFRNRARQAAITQEISEIVGGADAIAQ
jgi:F-type H+-transporting ATPase subunit gamma